MTEISDPSVQKVLEHRRFVLKEFVDSEKEYVERLRVTFEDYLNHIRAGGPNVPPTLKTDILSIFSTLPEIYSFHREILLPAMQVYHAEDAEAMVGVFLKHGSEFTSKYVAYCKNKPVSDSTRLEYDDFFTSRQLELRQKLNIEDLLIAPVQRLPRYQLLIRDLLKDTRKVNMDTTKIEEALELMQKIPKETNSIITLSLLRGIPRANVISHGTLWRQDLLVFSTYGGKEETMQVYLFDHRIIVATPADKDGFFHFELGIKTLNGKVNKEGTSEFQFSEEGGAGFRFRTDRKDVTEHWVTDLQSILFSQLQMKRALIFGKSAASSLVPRHPSIGLEWSDSDSSVDSMPDSDSDFEGDWPQKTGFTFLGSNKPAVSVTKTAKLPLSPRLSVPMTSIVSSSLTTLPRPDRPHSYHASIADIEQTMFRKSAGLSLSPRLLKRWLTQKTNSASQSSDRSYIYYPLSAHSLVPPRSPGALKRVSQLNSVLPPEETYYIAVETQPAVAEQVYKSHPGQVFLPLDVSRGDVWRVRVMSGSNAGEEVWLQRNMIEEYTAPIIYKPIKKVYSFISDLGRGRFSEVKLAKLKSNKKLVAVKLLSNASSEESFFRQLCILSRLKHSNLLSCQCGVYNGGMAIAMENINGRHLFDYLVRKSSVTETMVAGLMGQLLDALHYLHTHTIVHMDVRPSNLMIQITRSADVLKLIDFGAARHYGEESLTGQLEPCIDYQYLAPEVFKQESIGPGTDVWGVGVIIYIIFYGCSPFCGGSSVHTIANVTSVAYHIPTHTSVCSPEAVALLRDIFVLSTKNRPTAESAKSLDWFKLSESFKENKMDIAQLKLFIRNQQS
ncbi:kalirin-like [Halichondria panicea]|uniref:kalirin-like n=1 Tax=Halichondria panicea TaxID=6063 RepID=UPI00312B6386